MEEIALNFSGVSKRFADQAVIDGLDLALPAGEFFGLVGLNGAGKTTLIKSLLDFSAVDAGEIRIFGVRHRETRSRERVAFLPERFTPPYYLTGGDFLKYTARLHGAAYSREALATLLQALDLDREALAKPVHALSKGMSQKLGLAGCFLSGKDLLILDEPMSGLDPKARALLKEYLLALRARGHTLFFSTHLLADVEALCDRMGILHEGVLRFVGTPQACCRQYDAFNLEQAFLNCIGAGEPEAVA